jgi:hypothetical protein
VTYGTVEERVARGAAWLDAHFPGWEGRINLQTLALRSGEKCICGQLFADEARLSGCKSGFWYVEDHLFAQATAWIRWSPADVKQGGNVWAYLGFDVTPEWGSERQYAQLQEAWVLLLKTRHDTGTLSGTGDAP